jgi:hypothetical protein
MRNFLSDGGCDFATRSQNEREQEVQGIGAIKSWVPIESVIRTTTPWMWAGAHDRAREATES